MAGGGDRFGEPVEFEFCDEHGVGECVYRQAGEPQEAALVAVFAGDERERAGDGGAGP